MTYEKIIIYYCPFLLLTSCLKTKNEVAVKKLDGTWKATQYTEKIDGTSSDLIALGIFYQMTFKNNCNMENDEWCAINITESYGGDTNIKNWLYRVESEASILILTDLIGSQNPKVYFIKNLEKKTVTLQLVDDGVTSDIILEKQ